MIPLGLSAADEAALWETIEGGGERRRVRIRLLNANEVVTDDLSDLFVSGQVDVDATATVDRTASLTFSDPSKRMGFDPVSPDKAAVYADKMLAVFYEVKVASAWVEIPVMRGPISHYERSSGEVTIELQGKESLLLSPNVQWSTLHIHKHKLKTEAIRKIAASHGETRFKLSDINANKAKRRTPKPITVARQNEPWKSMAKLAKSLDCQLFYDGDGYLRLREWPSTPVELTTAVVITNPQSARDQTEARNAQLVTGRTASGKPIRGKWVAPNANPLAPSNLARNSYPRYMADFASHPHLRSKKQANDIARRLLNKKLVQQVDVYFDCLVLAMLEPHDILAVPSDEGVTTFNVETFTIPLSPDAMSVGYTHTVRTK